MKETADATVFKDHVLVKLEEASYVHALDSDMTLSLEEEMKVRELLTFVIIGGGPTGVELAGELTDFLTHEGSRQYGHLKEWISVHMFSIDLLAPFDQELQEYAARHLRKKQGVKLHLGTVVQSVEKDKIHLKQGDKSFTMPFGTLVWCAGIKPHPVVKDFGFEMNDRGTQILVDRTLKVKGEDDIYAVGDCCTVDGYWLPQTAQVAKQQGQYLAKQFNSLKDGQGQPFKFRSLGMMAYLGGFNAVMSRLPGLNSITGFLAFIGWRSVYWSLQLSLRNRFMLSTDWLRTMIFGRDLTRFGPPSRPQ